jgi:C-terminus of AA_permease
MMELDLGTWIRFAIWLAIGAIIYVTYAIRNSKERYRHLTPTTQNTVAVVAKATEDVKEEVPAEDTRIENEKL